MDEMINELWKKDVMRRDCDRRRRIDIDFS